VKRSSENAISFFGAGGHKHDGVSSTLISTDKYSLFDFNPGYRGSQSRITIQQANQAALEEWVMNLVNTKVLAPAGLDLAPGLLSGKSIRANTITATELQANTITADEIAANAVTANELAANLVLVNNVIRSNSYNGTIAANNVITSSGTTGWAITSAGQAVFSDAVIRGNVTANAGTIGGWAISSNTITAGSTTLSSTGAVTFGNTVIASNGQITNGGYTLSNTGVLTATGADISGAITATTITATISGRIGPFDLTSTSLKSTSYNAQNYMEILDYGDILIYSSPLDGGHANMRHRTDLVGEYIQVARLAGYGTNAPAINRYITLGSTNGGPGNIGIDIVENNVSKFKVYQDGHIYCSNVTATTFNGNATSATYADTAGSATPALRLGRILDTTATASGQDFVVANGGGIGMFRVAMNQEAYDKSVSGRTAVFNSSSLIGTTSSTARLKQDIESYTFNEQSILSMEPKRFRYNEKVEGGGDGSPWEYGFIAEEAVAAGLSELCGFDKDGLPDYFAYERMCIAQQQIIRTLWGKVESLESRIQTLEGV
jgi:hypothetical protein